MKKQIFQACAVCLSAFAIYTTCEHEINMRQPDFHPENHQPVAMRSVAHRALAGTILQGAHVVPYDTIDFGESGSRIW